MCKIGAGFIFSIPLSITNKMNVIQYSLLLSMLYMFQAVFSPIIGSSKLFTASCMVSGLFAATTSVVELAVPTQPR